MTIPEPIGALSPDDEALTPRDHATPPDRGSRVRPWQRSRVLKRLLRNKVAVTSMVVLALLVLVAIFGDLLAPQDPNKVSLSLRLMGPSGDHWLGTDELGRDVLSRLIVATRVDLLASLQAVGLALAIGVPLGVAAGYFAGWVDAVLSRVIDALMTLPPLILAVVIVAILGPGLRNAMLAIAVLIAPSFYRVVRASTQSARSELYIESARASGCTSWRILWRHILPAVAPPLLVQASFSASVVIVAEASLSFLGLGARAPQATWGLMLNEASSNLTTSSYLIYPPTVMVAITILALSLLGDGLRDALGRQTTDGR
ncbi:ABC transporter permease [Nocardioides sp. JQ2195]|uniref:ABC transporter permease n=1 Tax=Nocardioides sp. JQ2195 TaxID=2592334 RepID=UPI00143E43D4|nr:ABC transporter permease [Nocardioides sp. JQ2195]QIX26543.1 ABC transporter permease [Nocardioides sp. JQ2195]